MPEFENETFDDPDLKSAVRRAWAGERAPDQLRDRLRSLLSPRSFTMFVGSNSRRIGIGLALAAMVLLAVGIGLHTWVGRPGAPQGVPTVALSDEQATQIVARHDECCSAPDHHMAGLPHDDFKAIGSAVRAKLGFPILSAALPGAWQFHGASICPVGSSRSGHLVFERDGKQFVSLFSLPAGFAPGMEPNSDCERMSGGHPMAGFVTANGFYCVVGSSPDGSVTIDQVRSLRDQLRPDLAAGLARSGGRVTVAAQ